MKIGIISDTHGLLRERAKEALAGVEHILHAGDICDDAILEQLALIAPVTAVRGNCDFSKRCAKLPKFELLTLAGTQIYLHHGNDEALKFVPAGTQIVVQGHSHIPKTEIRDGVLFINPGSAGPRRFSLPVTLAILEILPNQNFQVNIVSID